MWPIAFTIFKVLPYQGSLQDSQAGVRESSSHFLHIKSVKTGAGDFKGVAQDPTWPIPHSTFFSEMFSSLLKRARPGPWAEASQREWMFFKLLLCTTHCIHIILQKLLRSGYSHSHFIAEEMEVQRSYRICVGSGGGGIWTEIWLTPETLRLLPQLTVSSGSSQTTRWEGKVGSKLSCPSGGSENKPGTIPQNAWEQTPLPMSLCFQDIMTVGPGMGDLRGDPCFAFSASNQ